MENINIEQILNPKLKPQKCIKYPKKNVIRWTPIPKVALRAPNNLPEVSSEPGFTSNEEMKGYINP